VFRPIWRIHAYAVAGYLAVTLFMTWPLVLHLGSHLTGHPGGDTGVYVWNQWVFHHELVDQRSLPYFTTKIFSLTGRADLSLHNYTTFQNLMALPLMHQFGVVATFNLVYLVMTVLTAYMAFRLAHHVTQRSAEAWIAGMVFAWSPVLVTRGMGHFSVAAAAPLAAFLLVLLRTAERERLRDAGLLGATVWWAAGTDVYFAVYCIVIAAVFLAARTLKVEHTRATPNRRHVPWALDVLLLCMAGLVLAISISGGWELRFLGRVARMRSLYTPMLVLTALAVVRFGWSWRTHLAARVDAVHAWRVARLAAVAGLLAAVMLSPVLYALGTRIAAGNFDRQRTFWRSSPHGVDVLALALPNPNHWLAPDSVRTWLSPRPDAYLENVASIPIVVAIVLLVAWRRGWRVPRLWAGFAVLFGLLALGPFVHVAGVNTYVPGPWALLRYLPVIGLARSPGRFTTVMMLALAVLFAGALAWLTARYPARRRLVLSVVAVAAFFELSPLPRTLYSAEIPAVYRHVAAAPADTRILELPFGVRDGTSSIGNFTARSQFFQTYHEKPLIGGYLSRVSRRRVADIRKFEMLDALIELSEGRTLDPQREARLIAEGPAFAERWRLGFVMIDCAQVPAAARMFALRAFRLVHIETDGEFELYRPADRSTSR
jgi:hypothetical protein